eukprot:TRINITY_DN8652_c2_g1_i1.p1 TRINITY_DN8652_c2_g1~~TRINITY_DN8652_c2_g1_i1.p1  ORF type:complete len:296 (+),score=54.79 TRINITY_DN8652_c2_g1_i1:39-890(+)
MSADKEISRPSPGAASLERCANLAQTLKNIMSSSESEILPYVARSGGVGSPNSLRHYESRIRDLERDNSRLLDKLHRQRSKQNKEISELTSTIEILEEGRDFLLEETRTQKSGVQQKTNTLQSALTDLQRRQDSLDAELQRVLSTPPKRGVDNSYSESMSPQTASTPERILNKLKQPLPIAPSNASPSPSPPPSRQPSYQIVPQVVQPSPYLLIQQPQQQYQQQQQQHQHHSSYPPNLSPSFSQKLNAHKTYLADELYKEPNEDTAICELKMLSPSRGFNVLT